MRLKLLRRTLSGVSGILLLAPIVCRAAPLWTEHVVAGTSAQTLPDFVALATKLSPAVVNISAQQRADENGRQTPLPGEETDPFGRFGQPFEEYGLAHPHSLGSGFIINHAGFILTNAHVIEGAEQILVALKDGRQFTARLIGRDTKTDIALIKIDGSGDLPVAPLGDSDQVQVGQWVMAIGNPFGFDHSVTAGIVSAKGRFIPGNYDSFIQTDASINPGNSGGPLINLQGAVVGVNSAIYTRSGLNIGIGFAIPVNLVKEELPQLSAHGRVTRGWLGVYIEQVSAEAARRARMPEPRGAMITEVLANGPAAAAGIRRGDIIVEFDHHEVGDSQELPLLVGAVPIGRTVHLKILRRGVPSELPITVARSDEEKLARASLQQEAFGLKLEDLTPDLAQQLNLSDSHGLVISAIRPGSAAENSGLHVRDIILEVNRRPVSDLRSYARALKSGGHAKIALLLVRRDQGTLFIPLKSNG
ncbi:MAG TPA: Do family serine endopeptidase [Candidatus Binataceae bacterium]|nr:Do family serine endopeptidase [Candidatus Binataceae bacterium]